MHTCKTFNYGDLALRTFTSVPSHKVSQRLLCWRLYMNTNTRHNLSCTHGLADKALAVRSKKAAINLCCSFSSHLSLSLAASFSVKVQRLEYHYLNGLNTHWRLEMLRRWVFKAACRGGGSRQRRVALFSHVSGEQARHGCLRALA